MPLRGYEQVPEGELNVTVKAVEYGSLNHRLPSDVEVDALPLPSARAGRSRAIVLGFAALLLTGIAIIGYASRQQSLTKNVPSTETSMPMAPNLSSLGGAAFEVNVTKKAGEDTTTTTSSSTTTTADADDEPVVAPPKKPSPPPAFTCRACTADECKTGGCDPKGAPFTCVAGFAKGGCSKVAKSWDNPGCTDCCDMGACASLEKPCGNCTATDCQRLGPICGVKRPFACVEGPSMGGCSDDPDNWPPQVFSGVCARCCDLSTCPEQPGCKPCTEVECIQVGRGCFNSSTPFVCSQGAAMGGCSESEAYWKSAEFSGICQKCCDTTNCKLTPLV